MNTYFVFTDLVLRMAQTTLVMVLPLHLLFLLDSCFYYIFCLSITVHKRVRQLLSNIPAVSDEVSSFAL